MTGGHFERFVCAAMAAGIIYVITDTMAQQNQPASQSSCSQQLKQLSDEWQGIKFSPEADLHQNRNYGWNSHAHSEAEIVFLEAQLQMAERLCTEGKEHDAMLRMDVARAILKLPEVSHPASHRYKPPSSD